VVGFCNVGVYLKQRVTQPFLSDLDWREEDKGANLWIIRANDPGVFHGQISADGVPCVSAVQTYLDLQAMPERAEEAAESLRGALLQWP